MHDQPKPQDNHLLAALSPEVQSRLFPHLELISLRSQAIMYESLQTMRHVYFPTDSIISLHCLLEDGESAALTVVGNEGFLGVSLFLAEGCSTSRSMVHRVGYAYRLPLKQMKAELDRNEQLMGLMLRYARAFILEVAQTTICNRHHSIAQQLCRWLLLSLDRGSGDRLMLTQEHIGNMIGVRREGITEAASNLQRLGIITYSRGSIRVIDRPKLETLVCECYDSLKNDTHRLLDYLPQRQAMGTCAPSPLRRLKRNI